MKYLKTFNQLNEGLSEASNLKKTFDYQLKQIDDISKSIVGSKDLLKAIQKEKPDVAKSLKGYFDLSVKAQKLVKAVKSKGLSTNRKKSEKQIKALTNFSSSLK